MTTMTTATEYGEFAHEYMKGFGQEIYSHVGGAIGTDSMTNQRDVSVRIHSDNSASTTIANNPSASKAKEKTQVALAQANGMHHEQGFSSYLHVTRDKMAADVMSRTSADGTQQTLGGYW